MTKEEQFLLTEECEKIEYTLNEFLGFGKKPYSSGLIAKSFRDCKETILDVGEMLTKGEYEKALTHIKNLSSKVNGLESNLSDLVKGQEKIKSLKVEQEKQKKVEELNKKSNE